MAHFLKNIKINSLFHLHNISIPIENEQAPHLLITGKNGSGKTVLLDAMADYLEAIEDGPSLSLGIRWSESPVQLEFVDFSELFGDYREGNFILAFYPADRKVRMEVPSSPMKPDVRYRGVRGSVTNQFLYFLSDLKIQEALARNEGMEDDANEIRDWFTDFEHLLQQIYQDPELSLNFNYKNYSFTIHTDGKSFMFNETSDGFAAVLDIVADLILKMQSKDKVVRAYQKKGIVLIDEVETHLHLELQKIVMPLLTRIFPNIQFVVTTHSPFVLSSLKNAVAYDLETRQVIDELTDYSYASLAEGYFGVRSESNYMQMQLENLKSLLEKEAWDETDKEQLRFLIDDFTKVPEAVSPKIVGQFLSLKNMFSEKIKAL